MFEKNVERIGNINLKRRLMKINPNESKLGISFCITPSNDYVLLKDDIPVEDLNNPREAAKQILKENIHSEMGNNDIIITFGIGLGYLLDETYINYPSKIFVYEPDLNLLHFVLSNIDISEHLSSGRVFIMNNLDELISKLSEIYLTKDKVEIVYLKNYAIVKNKELLLLTQKVLDTCKSKIVDINTISKFSKKWLINTLNNISTSKTKTLYPVSELENKFTGQTALIIGAGPSLNENIDNIKKNRKNFVIFAVNKVAKYLFENQIFPDFIVCLDADYINKSLDGLDSKLERTNCLMDIRTDSSVLNHAFHKIFVNFSETDAVMKKASKYNAFMKFNETGGSASTFALTSAVKMGFSQIVLTGIDLAFKGNQIYSDGETMQRVSQNEIVVDSIKKNLVQIDSVTGGKVYTREDYAVFINHFNTLVKQLNYSKIYNTSSFGAKLEGVQNTSFENVNTIGTSSLASLAFVSPLNIELKDFFKNEFFYINNIIAILSKDLFSPELVSSVIKSVLVYQLMQADVLTTLQHNFEPDLAKNFIEKTKFSIKTIVEQLQKNKLI
jgi:hypothetical protein